MPRGSASPKADVDIATISQVATRPVGRKILFSAMKNEAPFILEWVAYHRLIGFDEIVICSNRSNDGTEELLAAMADAGEIRHLQATVAEGQSPQSAATAVFESAVGFCAGDWYLWIDADEFLNVHVGDRTVTALTESLGDKKCALINWRLFGANGNARFGGRFIDPAFTGSAASGFRRNRAVKSMFRHSGAFAGFAKKGIHRPVVSTNSPVMLDDVVVGNGGQPTEADAMHRRWLAGFDDGRTNTVPAEDMGWSLAQINHYAVRTPDYFALKKMRGRGNKAAETGAENDRHGDAFFRYYNRNEAEDRSILFWQSKVTEKIAEYMRVKAIASAAARSAALVENVLRQTNPTPDHPAPAVPMPSGAEAATPVFQLTFPRAERKFILDSYDKAATILEYGSGGSTVLAARGGSHVISVESDRAWADRLNDHLADLALKATLHHVDIGPTKAWGHPKGPEAAGRYHAYALSVWDRPDFQHPDLVLIDGRFRAACFAATLMRITRPVMVLFDDYKDRPCYHGVEKLCPVEQLVGRMAIFALTPRPVPADMLTEVIGWFADPR